MEKNMEYEMEIRGSLPTYRDAQRYILEKYRVQVHEAFFKEIGS